MKVTKEESNMTERQKMTGRFDNDEKIGKQITFELARVLCRLAYNLPDDVKKRIEEMAGAENDPAAKKVYECMLENLDLADRLSRPLCQDTGIPNFYIKAGARSPVLGMLEKILKDASAGAFADAPLRPNAIDPFTGKNSGNNEGPRAPYIDWEIVQGDEVEITAYLCGGGCSLPGFALVLTPGEGLEKAKELIIAKILEKGVNACPPLAVGVGIGATADIAAKLSKKALLRPAGSVNGDPNAAKLEKELFERINALRIGPSGMGGAESVLAVNVEFGVRHPATFAVGLSTGCWATRRCVIKIDGGLNVKVCGLEDRA